MKVLRETWKYSFQPYHGADQIMNRIFGEGPSAEHIVLEGINPKAASMPRGGPAPARMLATPPCQRHSTLILNCSNCLWFVAARGSITHPLFSRHRKNPLNCFGARLTSSFSGSSIASNSRNCGVNSDCVCSLSSIF